MIIASNDQDFLQIGIHNMQMTVCLDFHYILEVFNSFNILQQQHQEQQQKKNNVYV